MVSKYKVGENHIFHIDDVEDIGEIIAIHKRNHKIYYDFKISSIDGSIIYKNIPEKNIGDINSKTESINSNWVSEHIEEICFAFGKDVADKIILDYDSPNDVEDCLKEYFHPTSQFFKPVLNKWVGILD